MRHGRVDLQWSALIGVQRGFAEDTRMAIDSGLKAALAELSRATDTDSLTHAYTDNFKTFLALEHDKTARSGHLQATKDSSHDTLVRIGSILNDVSFLTFRDTRKMQMPCRALRPP
jgi:hypothetical protein